MQIKETPIELLDEVSVFLNFLKYRSQYKISGAKTIDSEYNDMVAPISSTISNAAKATIWEQIKDDSW